MNPLISIIIPVYNTSAYLYRCLDSVCMQTYENIEIICVNDGSTDNSLEILNKYASKDGRISVITTENRGLGAARNRGLERANGEWILGLDSDDYLEFDTCEYLISNICDGIEVVQFGFLVKSVRGSNLFYVCRLKGVHKVSVDVLVGQSCEFCGKLWKKSFLNKNKCCFPEGLWYEDCFFYWAYMPLANGVLYLPECKYVYVRRVDSIMGKSDNKDPRCIDHVRILELLLAFRSRDSFLGRFSELNLINFIQSWRFVESRVPDTHYEIAIEKFKELASLSIMKPWRKWLVFFVYPFNKRKLFRKYGPGLVYIGFMDFWPLKVGIEADMIVWRLFGKRIYSQKLIS